MINFEIKKKSNAIRVFLLLQMAIIFHSCGVEKNAIVAHHGAWKKNNLPENSIASLRHAIDLKLPRFRI
jgi:glycerophosphoryl diester phosphodiesterase